MDRRQLLQGLVAGAAASSVPGWAQAPTAGPRVPLGVQFFTFSSFASSGRWEDFAAGMAHARRIGYDGIEFAGLFGHKPDVVRKHADELGLKLRSYHLGNDIVRAFQAPAPSTVADAQDAAYTPIGVVQICRATVGVARDLGVEYAGLGATGRSNFTSMDAVKRLGDAFNACAEITSKAGLKFFYHNHAIDFKAIDGRIPYEYFMEQCDPRVRFQFDTGWAGTTGIDPLNVLTKYASRIDIVHLRDSNAAGQTVVPGDGTIDFAKVRAVTKERPNLIFHMEGNGRPQTEAVAEATRAYTYLRKFGWGARPA